LKYLLITKIVLGSKYSLRSHDPRIIRILGGSTHHINLVSAAYADSTWKKINCALNLYESFCASQKKITCWPISENVLGDFIDWATFSRNIKPSSIVSYISHLKLIHKLRKIDDSACNSFLCKTLIKGAENLQFYSNKQKHVKKTMTLPLLRLLGHSIANSGWSTHSQSVVWACYTVAFFGSYRLGEILPKHENTFNPFETLLWSDVKFIETDSIQIHSKITKTRKPGGEYVSLFTFPYHGCCPVAALKFLAKISNANKNNNFPVFRFNNGRHLTKNFLNKLIGSHLKPHIGDDSFFYSCKSFRAALPSALASDPHSDNDRSIKQWGRWSSDAFERYTKLNHNARKKLFKKFSKVLRRA
jgi:hypothetical protein